MNWEKICKDLHASPFNAISLHIISPWDNDKGIYPFEFDTVKKRYNVNKPNETYYAEVEKMMERLAYYWLGIEISFFDSYFEDKWIDDQPWPYHPLRNNNTNLHLADKGQVKWFYDGVLFTPEADFLWISWEDVSNYVFKNYKLLPPLGQPLINYVRRIMEIVAKVKKKYPGFRVRYKTFNETKALGNELDKNGYLVADRNRSIGDRIEIQSYVRDLWKEYIVSPMTIPKGYIDYMAYLNGDPHYPTLGKAATSWIPKTRMSLEIHHAYDKKHVQGLLDNGVPKTALFSSDGKKEAPEVHYGTGDSEYFSDLAEVEKLKLPNVDYKLWARYKGSRKWRIGDMMYNWNEFFPLMSRIF